MEYVIGIALLLVVGVFCYIMYDAARLSSSRRKDR